MLSPDAKAKIEAHLAKFPIAVRERAATEAELREFEAAFGAIPDDYRWLLVAAVAAWLARSELTASRSLPSLTPSFAASLDRHAVGRCEMFSLLAGMVAVNPFGIEQSSGRILVEDHDFGGIHEMAASLQEFILR